MYVRYFSIQLDYDVKIIIESFKLAFIVVKKIQIKKEMYAPYIFLFS